MNNKKDKVLIIGGYGRAGRSISQLLAGYGEYEIIISGRTLEKAQNYIVQLKNDFPEGIFKAIGVDINNNEKLTDIIADIQLVIIAVPLNYRNTLTLIDAVLKSKNASYIDLSPGNEKHKAFRERKHIIENSIHLFVLDCGFEPGLPGFMSHWALSELDNPSELRIEGIYRDPQIPKGGIEDILGNVEPAFILKEGKMIKASPFKLKMTEFPDDFGKALSIPIWMPELQSIPSKYNLKYMTYYHAGINGLANFIMLCWQSFLNKFLSTSTGVVLFRWAIQNFTKKPYGGIIRVIAKSSNLKKELIISHHELYGATAIPVVATARAILQNIPARFGYFFMGEWVERVAFLQNMEALGLKITINFQNNKT